MTDPNIRADVVSLLVDLDPFSYGSPVLRRLDGRPMTDAERGLINSATGPEHQAAADYFRRVAEHAEEMASAHRRIDEITRPYFDRLDSGATMADVLPLLTEAERAEIDRLHEIATPDGTIIMGDI